MFLLLLLNAFSTFSPLFFSSGTAYFMAKSYTQRVSRQWACIVIITWCFCGCCTGIALLSHLHAVALNNIESAIGFYLVILIPLLWLANSIALLLDFVGVSFFISSANLIAHFIFFCNLLHIAGKAAALFIFFGMMWLGWSCFFSFSLFLLLRHRAMKPIADAAVACYMEKGAIGRRRIFSYK